MPATTPGPLDLDLPVLQINPSDRDGGERIEAWNFHFLKFLSNLESFRKQIGLHIPSSGLPACTMPRAAASGGVGIPGLSGKDRY